MNKSNEINKSNKMNKSNEMNENKIPTHKEFIRDLTKVLIS